MGKYDDIIKLEVPTSKNHPRMSSYNRAAQFAPFAALVGYAEAINDSKENSDERKMLSQDKKEEIEGVLQIIKRKLHEKPQIEVEYYEFDKSKKKHHYVKYKGMVKNIDELEHKIIFTDKKTIFIKDIFEIRLLYEAE